MEQKYQLTITPWDRLMHAWEVSMGLVRDYRAYAREINEDNEAVALFEKMAENECVHASRLLKLLHERDHKEP